MTISDIAKQITETHSAMLVRVRKDAPNQYDAKPTFTGNHRGWVLLDLFTASAINTVYNALSEQNKSKFNTMPLPKVIRIVWQLVK